MKLPRSLAILLILSAFPVTANPTPVTFDSLLHDMIDRDRLAVKRHMFGIDCLVPGAP